MTIELKISFVAIILAVCSFGLSLYVVLRDRPKLTTESRVYKHRETNEYNSLYFKVVNVGRRSIILTLIQGLYENSNTCGTYIDHENKGIKLEENEFYEYQFGKYDGIMICDPNGNGECHDLIDLQVADSTNKKYKIKDAKKHIQRLRNSKHLL